MKDWPVQALSAEEYAKKLEAFQNIALCPGAHLGTKGKFLGAPMLVDAQEQIKYVLSENHS